MTEVALNSKKLLIILTADHIETTGRISYGFVVKVPADARRDLDRRLEDAGHHPMIRYANQIFGVVQNSPYGDGEINPFVLMQQGADAHAAHTASTTRLSWEIRKSITGQMVEAGSCDFTETAVQTFLPEFPRVGVYLMERKVYDQMEPWLADVSEVEVFHAHIPGSVRTG